MRVKRLIKLFLSLPLMTDLLGACYWGGILLGLWRMSHFNGNPYFLMFMSLLFITAGAFLYILLLTKTKSFLSINR